MVISNAPRDKQARLARKQAFPLVWPSTTFTRAAAQEEVAQAW